VALIFTTIFRFRSHKASSSYKKVLSISLFSAQVKISVKTVQNILKRQALVFQCIKRPLYYDDT